MHDSERRREGMRLTVVAVGAIGAALAVVAGLVFIPMGLFEQRDADAAYVVAFARSGDDCPRNGLVLSAFTGEPLACKRTGIIATGAQADLPGFTAEQTRKVVATARDRGSDGLSAGDRREIQELVDRYAAGVPAGERPYAGVRLWGLGRVWTGVAMMVAGLLAGLLVVRRGIDWI